MQKKMFLFRSLLNDKIILESGFFSVPSDTCMELSTPLCLSSSEFEEDWHFLFTVMGTLQLSKYLMEREGYHQWKRGLQTTNQTHKSPSDLLSFVFITLFFTIMSLS